MIYPKEWILKKNLSFDELRAVNQGCDWTVESETEKAYLFKAITDFGKITVWCPKSQVINTEDQVEVDGKKYIRAIYEDNKKKEERPYSDKQKAWAEKIVNKAMDTIENNCTSLAAAGYNDLCWSLMRTVYQQKKAEGVFDNPIAVINHRNDILFDPEAIYDKAMRMALQRHIPSTDIIKELLGVKEEI